MDARKPEEKSEAKPAAGWRLRLHEIIFESDTAAGKAFDVALIWLILFSVATVMVESIQSIKADYGNELIAIEWFFTIIFTIEYVLRLIAVRRPLSYATSFFGVVDLLAVVPNYLSLLLPGAQSLLVIRMFRLLRVFRIFKLGHYLTQASVLQDALRASRPKIIVFLVGVSATVVTVGAVMYLVEGEQNGFTSIPKSIYWAIVTMTTVGFGDITPQTPLGQFIASLLMIAGYGVIAVPTGIVTSELVRSSSAAVSAQACPVCGREGHDMDAFYCKYCGSKI